MADTLQGWINGLSNGSLSGLITAVVSFISIFVKDAPGPFKTFAGVLALGIAVITALAWGIKNQLEILPATDRGIARDFALEGKGSGGWTKAGLELFKNNELDSVRGQYGSTFLSQLVLNVVPEIAGLINTSIEELFYQIGGDITSILNAQEEDLTTEARSA